MSQLLATSRLQELGSAVPWRQRRREGPAGSHLTHLQLLLLPEEVHLLCVELVHLLLQVQHLAAQDALTLRSDSQHTRCSSSSTAEHAQRSSRTWATSAGGARTHACMQLMQTDTRTHVSCCAAVDRSRLRASPADHPQPALAACMPARHPGSDDG